MQQLRTFVTVARDGSITRASEHLALSQPAVSAHIKTLEELLGLSLFERTPRGMCLTLDGELLLVKAELALGAYRELLEEATRLKGRLGGKLRLGCASSVTAEVLGHLLAYLAERHPEVSIVLTHGTSVEVRAGVLSGALEAGLYNTLGELDAQLCCHEIARSHIYLVAPASLREQSKETNWAALEMLPWICPNPSTCCGQAAEALFRMHKIRPRNIIRVDRDSITRALVAAGTGVGLLHADSARAAHASGEVRLVCETPSEVQLLFAQHVDRTAAPLLRALSAALLAVSNPRTR